MKRSIGVLFALVAAAAYWRHATAAMQSGRVRGRPRGRPVTAAARPNKLEVLYPIPNTRKAPPALANIYVSTKGQLAAQQSVRLLFGAVERGDHVHRALYADQQVADSSNPHATPSYSNPCYYASAIAGPYGSSYVIGPDQSVSLLWNNGGRELHPALPGLFVPHEELGAARRQRQRVAGGLQRE